MYSFTILQKYYRNVSNLDHIVSSGLKSRGLVIRVLDLGEEFAPVNLNTFEWLEFMKTS